jgi:hypothetical protein
MRDSLPQTGQRRLCSCARRVTGPCSSIHVKAQMTDKRSESPVNIDERLVCVSAAACATPSGLMPRSAHVRAAMIAHRADHAGLQLVEGGLVGQVARVEDGVVMAARV